MSSATTRISLAALVATAALVLSLALTGAASAAPVGKDGKIHACYRVKGKPKGAMRVVRSSRARCARGERKVSWMLAGSVGASGAPGATGAGGGAGSAGAAGTNSALSTVELEETIDLLGTRVTTLEGVLEGVTNEALTDAIAAVGGLTNAELLAAVSAVPLVDTLCGEVTGLVTQTNLLRGSVNTLVSTLSGSLLGAIFGGVSLPAVLPETLTCPGA